MMKSPEQLPIDYDKKPENEKDQRLRVVVEKRLRERNKKDRLGFDFIHGVNAEFNYFGEDKTIRDHLTEPMQEEWDLEIFKKAMKIAKDSGFLFTKGVEEEIKRLEEKVKKRRAKTWPSIEDSLPENDR